MSNDPFSKLGALDQKLYEKPKQSPAPITQEEKKPDVAANAGAANRALAPSDAAARTTAIVLRRDIPGFLSTVGPLSWVAGAVRSRTLRHPRGGSR